jgi:hypothetical protein
MVAWHNNVGSGVCNQENMAVMRQQQLEQPKNVIPNRSGDWYEI